MTNMFPKNLPNSKELLAEGKRIAAGIEIGKNGFEIHRGQSFFDWYFNQIVEGQIIFMPQLGLKSVDDQEEGLKRLYEGYQEVGIDLGIVLIIASMLNGVPFQARENMPSGTSYVYDGLKDYKRICQSSPVFAVIGDFAVGSPNSVENVTNALISGCFGVGTLSQFSWRFPYWHDEVVQIAETVKSMGIIAAKRDEMASLGSYLGDGIPSAFVDHASIVGYTLIEQYISEKLCGAAYTASLGGLMSNVVDKYATMLALNEVAKLDEFSPVIDHIEGNTIEVTSQNIDANYGLVISDFILFALLERKYKTGAMYTPKPVSEALRVPTVDEIVDVAGACKASMNRVLEIEGANMFDDTEILKLKDKLVINGKKFYDNAMNGLSDMGVDIEDPVQMLLALRQMGAEELEAKFNPGEKKQSRFRGFVPTALTAKQERYENLVGETLARISEANLDGAARDKTIVIGSADTHQFALFVMSEVLNTVGARVINAGVDNDPEHLLELAAKEGTSLVAVSIHNGQCVDWVKTFMELNMAAHQEARLFVGGTLNTMIDSCPEPVDATEILIETGAIPCRNILELLRNLERQPAFA